MDMSLWLKGKRQLAEENRRLVKIQELLVDDILTVSEKETTYTGNRYKTYSDAVTAISDKYAGTADWGVIQAGNIIDLRSSYIIGQGLKVSADEGGESELEWAQNFIEKNQLDHELAQDLAREAEIEGKVLIKLFPISPPEVVGEPIPEINIGIRWISWTTNKYTVNVDKEDYLQIENVTWQPTTGGEVKLLPNIFVYKRFAGRLDVINDTVPRTGKCLTQIENLDMALRDWRQINKLYAAPTPHITCENAEQAKKLSEQIDSVNWKVGKFFSHTGELAFAQPDASGQQALENEIITLMKVISGCTGVPINALGCPELTTKYGADNQMMMDLITTATSKEREVWRGAYTELIIKAMKMWNAVSHKTPLNPELIHVEIPMVTKEQWDRLINVWLPLFNSQAITLPTLLEQVPGLDVEAEVQAREEADEEAFQKAKAMAEAQGKEDDEEKQKFQAFETTFLNPEGRRIANQGLKVNGGKGRH